MILEKVSSATIDVRDPDNFCADPGRVAADYLRRMYVGRCYQGVFILEILEILRLGPCMIKDTETSGEGSVDVQFLARASVLARWDILTGVRVVTQTPALYGLSRTEGQTAVHLRPTPEAKTVAVGQLVAVRISEGVRYDPYQEVASAVGVLLTCDKAAVAARPTTERLSAADAEALAPLVSRAARLLERRAALAEKRRDDLFFFEELLYAYALPGASAAEPRTVASADAPPWVGPAGVPLPPGAEARNLLDVVGRAAGAGADVSGVWCRDLALYRSSPLAAVAAGDGAAAPPPSWGDGVAAEPPRALFAEMLGSVCTFLKAVEEMAEVYSSPETLAAHRNIWLAMRRAQLPPPG